MKNWLVFTGIIVCFLYSTKLLSQEASFIISEFQTANTLTIADEDTTFSDWIEIYNASQNRLNLEGWSLTDRASTPKEWVFPSLFLNAGEYLLVFASGKDRNEAGNPLHTNFKLSSDGEYLALNNPSGTAVSVWNPFPALLPDQSFGLLNGKWMIFSTPTPGTDNLDGIISSYPQPVFDHQRGFYEQPFSLTMSCVVPDAAMYYTTDGSVPSITNGTLYSHPLIVSETTILRAITIGSVADSLTSQNSKITTCTFLFIEDILKQSNTPVGYPSSWGNYSDASMGTSIGDYEMDPELIAEKVYTDKIRQSFLSLPIVSLVTDKNNLFNNVNDSATGGIYIFTGVYGGTGSNWERPVSFEYFSSKDSTSIQSDAGLELHGSASRLPEKSPKHSFKIAFKQEYGPTKLKYHLFGKSEASSINSFYLRSGFGFSWIHWDNNNRNMSVYARDEWAKRTQKKMGDPSGNTQHAHLFINGLYWGLYNPTEKIDDDFCESYLGGDETEWDVFRMEEMNAVWKDMCTLAAGGSDTVYQQIQGNNPDGTPNPTFEPLLDVENFIDYMILNFYGGNDDWDHHNWIAARNRVTPGKGFRLFCWDSESLLLSTTSNLIGEYNKNCPSDLFQNLRKNPAFCRLWGDRIQKHCFNNGALTPTQAAETFTQLITPIEDGLYAEAARWGDYRRDVHRYSSAGVLYRKEVHFDAQKKWMLETYFPQRTTNFVKYMTTGGLFPSVSAPSLEINGLAIKKDTIEQGDKLTMSATFGNIYYTIDQTDPVKWTASGSGTINTSTKLYGSAIQLDQNVRIKARTIYNGVWSALVDQNLVIQNSVGLNQPIGYYDQVQLINAPNPFTEFTTFQYNLPFDGLVSMTIIDLSGRSIATVLYSTMNAGNHETTFDGSRLKGGIYLCQLDITSGSRHQHKVIRLVKM
jgi:hypothetical protein